MLTIPLVPNAWRAAEAAASDSRGKKAKVTT
jgi:hypothetical protein